MKRKGFREGVIALAVLAACTGCSRATINYQIAESIGTLGMYENNEPVETPRMKAEREQREIAEAEEQQFQQQLAEAEKLASSYWYNEAIAYLENVEKTELNTERIDLKIEEYRESSRNMRIWTGDVPHLCFPVLIEDTDRAFDEDDYSAVYNSQMVTVKEFKGILEELYKNGYVLINIEDIAALTTDSRGVTMMDQKELKLPSDKKPIILSQDNLNYSGMRNGDGIANSLTVDEDGNVKAIYTDSEGHDLVGDYDFIPILDSFIDSHSDFSYHGARGIVSVSVSEGIFGYDVAEGALMTNDDNKQKVRRIAEALSKNGWKIACAGYSHGYMNDMTLDELTSEINQWKTEAGTLVGNTNILFYPYGGEVRYPSDRLDYLTDSGLVYLCGLWADTDFTEIGEKYMRQTRRFVDGYTLQNAPSYFSAFFNVSSIIDDDR